jgi:hypothetical protein
MIRTMHWSTKISRAIIWKWCARGGMGALFAELPAAPERPLRYVMVLKTRHADITKDRVKPVTPGEVLGRSGCPPNRN